MGTKHTETPWDRIDAKTLRSDGCWLFTGAKNQFGYGRITIRKNGVRTGYLAHRVSYENIHGPIPNDMIVCHICDVPNCVRPDHLFLGTHADNVKDKVSKNRHRWCPPELRKRKLTDTDISEIRASTLTQRQLGRSYGVCHKTIGKIIRREIWK